mmetsp:Transcript_117787/g.375505  ORF Transcript_117787/g.375505 Transcript_117787/m.375505 type:complete len:605 (-) Transcript_117787:86-1900(-)
MPVNAVATGVLSSLFFVTLNVAMNIYMKWLFAEDGGDFALPWTMLATQQLQAYICLQPFICRKDPMGAGGWSFASTEIRAAGEANNDQVREGEIHRPLEVIHLFQVFVVTILFCLNVGLNSLSLVEISITLNQTVRAFLPVGVLLLASCLEQRAYPLHSYITTVILVLGIALTCWGSPDFQLHGFSLAFISTLVAAAGTSLNGRLLSKGPFSKGGPYGICRLMMIQSVPAFFIFGLIAWFTERERLVAKLMDPSSRWQWYQWVFLLTASSALALFSNLGRCFLVAATSALMETFAGNAKVAALCAIDHQLFGTLLYSYNYVGIALTFSGFSIHVLLQYASKEKESPPGKDESHRNSTKVDGSLVEGEESDMAGLKNSFGQKMRQFVRPRLVSAADTGLVCEHFALEMGRETKKRTNSDSSSNMTEQPTRQRAMTWQLGVDPLLQPEHVTWMTTGLEWNQIFEVPSLSWLDGGHAGRIAVVPAAEEYSPLNGNSPGARQNGGSGTPGGRARFWSDQMHDRTPKSRRTGDSSALPTIFQEDFSVGGGLASVEEETDDNVELGAFAQLPQELQRLGGGDSASDTSPLVGEAVVQAQRNLPPLQVDAL